MTLTNVVGRPLRSMKASRHSQEIKRWYQKVSFLDLSKQLMLRSGINVYPAYIGHQSSCDVQLAQLSADIELRTTVE